MGRVLLTDHAWLDDALERTLLEAAGHELHTAGSVAGGEREIEAWSARVRPDAVMTCWAPVSAAAIAAAPALRIVARLGVGLDNIAVDAATRAGAWVTNVPDYCVEDVSDHALALVLGWTRGIARFDADVKAGAWAPAGARLRRLAALTVGIVGLGRIGTVTARKLRGFGVSTIAHHRSGTGDGTTRTVPLDQLLAEADIVILHLPLTSATRHLIDAQRLAKMKPGALLVNVSRGGLVDTGALLAALDAGHLGGAALDVVEGEPNPPRELLTRSDVIVTPHVAFSSDVSLRELRTRASEDVVRALSGERPRYPCNDPGAASERAAFGC